MPPMGPSGPGPIGNWKGRWGGGAVSNVGTPPSPSLCPPDLVPPSPSLTFGLFPAGPMGFIMVYMFSLELVESGGGGQNSEGGGGEHHGGGEPGTPKFLPNP